MPRPTPLGWCAAVAIAAAAGTAMFLALHNAVLAAVVGVLGAVAFVLAGPPPESPPKAIAPEAVAPEPAPAVVPAAVPAPRAETAPAPVPQPVAVAAGTVPAHPHDQVSLLSAYLQEESDSYQPSYAPEAPTLVARVPGQTLTMTEPDSLAAAFATPAEPPPAADSPGASDGTAWRIGMDILPQSRSSALAVGNRLGSFRSAVVKARKEAKPKPSAGKHRAG